MFSHLIFVCLFWANGCRKSKQNNNKNTRDRHYYVSGIFTYASYGRDPHICAALFTNQVKFKLSVYRMTACEKNAQ